MPFNRKASVFSAPSVQNLTGYVGGAGRNYGSELAGARRHELTFPMSTPGIALGEYASNALLRMRRTFTASPDEDPTPTASNNFQNGDTMNGSYVNNFEATFRLNNASSTAGEYWDVYDVLTSFDEALYLNTVYTAESPIEFDSTTANREGEVDFKAVHVTWTENTYKNFRGLQKIIRHLGTVYVSSEDGGQPSATFTLRGTPPKVRRMQTGAFYGIMLHYSEQKNTGATASTEVTVDLKFRETPASNRIPYRW